MESQEGKNSNLSDASSPSLSAYGRAVGHNKLLVKGLDQSQFITILPPPIDDGYYINVDLSPASRGSLPNRAIGLRRAFVPSPIGGGFAIAHDLDGGVRLWKLSYLSPSRESQTVDGIRAAFKPERGPGLGIGLGAAIEFVQSKGKGRSVASSDRRKGVRFRLYPIVVEPEVGNKEAAFALRAHESSATFGGFYRPKCGDEGLTTRPSIVEAFSVYCNWQITKGKQGHLSYRWMCKSLFAQGMLTKGNVNYLNKKIESTFALGVPSFQIM
ncbi:hypothetical protein H5410_061205 [Solanum commersonii]|uniref:Uncharacterized protein n=1 Tax=Solanum commersonii TaxID=4109 RepID=A0A9J5W7Y0_SOLCO|nr:hypothetical protein H5410_061205 [Solanum commersonii]